MSELIDDPIMRDVMTHHGVEEGDRLRYTGDDWELDDVWLDSDAPTCQDLCATPDLVRTDGEGGLLVTTDTLHAWLTDGTLERVHEPEADKE